MPVTQRIARPTARQVAAVGQGSRGGRGSSPGRSYRSLAATIDTSAVVLRTATFRGASHLVVPVIAMVGNSVVWPMGARSWEFVPAEELELIPESWDGRPVLPDHPDGSAISANDPRILESMQFGMMFHTRFEDGKLKTDAYLDPAMAETVGGDALAVISRCQAGERVEVSVGCFVTAVPERGVYRGQEYGAVWRDIIPDHLAMLPEGTTGACSVEMGCGAPRLNRSNSITNDPVDPVRRYVFMPQRTNPQNRQSGQSGPARQSTFRRRGAAQQNAPAATPPAVRPVRTPATPRQVSSRQVSPRQAAPAPGEEAAELVYYQTIAQSLTLAAQSLASAQAITSDLISDETESPAEGDTEEQAEEAVEMARLQSIAAIIGQAISALYGAQDATWTAITQAMADDGNGMADDVQYVYILNSDGSRSVVGRANRSLEGRRHSAEDQALLQAMHDQAVSLGAQCTPAVADSGGVDLADGYRLSSVPAETDPPCSCTQSQRHNSSGESDDPDPDPNSNLNLNPDPDPEEPMPQNPNPNPSPPATPTAPANPSAVPPASLPDGAAQPVGNPAGNPANPAGNPQTPTQPAHLAASARPVPLQQYLAGLPPEVREIVDRSMAEERTRRDCLVQGIAAATPVYTAERLSTMLTADLVDLARALQVDTPVTPLPRSYSGVINSGMYPDPRAAEQAIYTNPPDTWGLDPETGKPRAASAQGTGNAPDRADRTTN